MSSNLPWRMGVMVKPTSFDCNLRCTYCYYRRQLEDPDSGHPRITDEILEQLYRQVFALSPAGFNINWQGGEPTMMGVEFFRRTFAVQKKIAGAGVPIANSLQTNAVLIDEPFAELLAAERVLVGASLDGPKEICDVYRVDAGNRSTYDRVKAGIGAMRDAGAEFNILGVVSQANCTRAAEVLNGLADEGFTYSQFIPAYEFNPQTHEREPYAPTRKQTEQFYCDVIDAWIERDDPTVSVRTIDNLLHAYFGLAPEMCYYRDCCENLLTIEANGDVYPCDFFVQQRYRLGNLTETPIREMIKGETFALFAGRKKRHMESCTACPWLGLCRGGCPRTWDFLEATGEEGVCGGMPDLLRYAFAKFDALCSGRVGAKNLQKRMLELRTEHRTTFGRFDPSRSRRTTRKRSPKRRRR